MLKNKVLTHYKFVKVKESSGHGEGNHVKPEGHDVWGHKGEMARMELEREAGPRTC